jgi:CubicO group peptidase (beta-lactamase class C family)
MATADRLHGALSPYVERGDMPGLIALVARGDDVQVEVIGTKSFEDTTPLPRDAIFRIASMSKPITAVVAMLLVDDGTLRLSDSVDEYLPELAGRRVLASLDAEIGDTVPARRAITIEDLLTGRMGFGSGPWPMDSLPIQRAEAALELRTLRAPWPPSPHTPDDWIRAFATLPLIQQPGEGWLYNTGIQVLGVLLERAAGQPLEALLRERLFEPLGMRDTAFSVPGEKRDRFTTAYAPDPQTGRLDAFDRVDDSYWSAPPAMPNAAGWLVSTIDDFWTFASMMRNRGVHDGNRLLAEESFTRMTTDQLTPEERESAVLFLGSAGWGFGMAAPRRDRPSSVVPGGFGWDGGTGTSWRTDLARDVTGILFTQRAMTSPEPPQVMGSFWQAAYE